MLYQRAGLSCSQDKGPFPQVAGGITETPDILVAVVLVRSLQVLCLILMMGGQQAVSCNQMLLCYHGFSPNTRSLPTLPWAGKNLQSDFVT